MAEAEPLTTLMASGPMAVEEVLRIGRDAAAALTRVHGELWPSAILVSPNAVEVLPPSNADRSRFGQYAAPERLLGKPATLESDVFSLAAILFHALAGRPAFRGTSAAEVMLAVMADKPAALHELRNDAPKELDALLAKCLERSPSERYPSCAAMRAALETITIKRANAWPGRRILIADDDAPVRDLHANIIARVGVEADVVASGRDAIEALKSRRYDVALLDLNMPRLSGWEVLDFLRTRTQFKPQRIFIITGFSDQMMSEADRDLVTAVLNKPVQPETLRNLITLCLNGESTATIDAAAKR
ncbi:MAG TPA: response regulator [Thermoanaerobaculia bacterium]|nr:response regulator [Thermoanaerobaculia bacterium]